MAYRRQTSPINESSLTPELGALPNNLSLSFNRE